MPTKKTKLIKCPSCGGDGLYKRHTSYTRDGKPFCFRCDGTGQIIAKNTKPDCRRHHKWQVVGPYSTPKYIQSNQVDLTLDEIPF